MMELKEFRIELDDPSPSRSYSPGENVTGSVIITATNERIISGLQLHCRGQMLVTFTSPVLIQLPDRSYKWENKKFSHLGDIFSDKLHLIGDGENYAKIKGGRNVYKFTFTIPPGINTPVSTTFSGDFGKVWYEVSATITYPDISKKDVVKAEFKVVATVDLEKIAGAGEPEEWIQQKRYGWLWCKTGSLGFIVKLPKQGFLPLEFISPSVEVFNRSGSISISHTILNFVQIVTYFAQDKSKTSTKVLAKIERGEVKPGKNDIWPSKRLQVPLVPPSGGNRIRFAYFLKVELHIYDFPSTLNKWIPITIGSIPLKPTTGLSSPPNPEVNNQSGWAVPTNSEGYQETPARPSAPSLPLYPSFPVVHGYCGGHNVAKPDTYDPLDFLKLAGIKESTESLDKIAENSEK